MSEIDCTAILKALADRSRMRIVKELLAKPLGVNELAEALETSQYNVSKHLRVLKETGIVGMRADGPRHEHYVIDSVRKSLKKQGHTLDFGCCTFDFDQLPG